jgi:hypothetical protein
LRWHFLGDAVAGAPNAAAALEWFGAQSKRRLRVIVFVFSCHYEIEESTMFKRKLACSFCRRSEAEVAKLVAGPRVYICDRCAAEAVRIMNESDAAVEPTSAR